MAFRLHQPGFIEHRSLSACLTCCFRDVHATEVSVDAVGNLELPLFAIREQRTLSY